MVSKPPKDAGTREKEKNLLFYLRLNSYQRKWLLGANETAATQEEWINDIISAENDIPIVFYYLQKNPSVLQSAGMAITQHQQAATSFLRDVSAAAAGGGGDDDHLQRPRKRSRHL
jgi:hypothetical protein